MIGIPELLIFLPIALLAFIAWKLLKREQSK